MEFKLTFFLAYINIQKTYKTAMTKRNIINIIINKISKKSTHNYLNILIRDINLKMQGRIKKKGVNK